MDPRDSKHLCRIRNDTSSHWYLAMEAVVERCAAFDGKQHAADPILFVPGSPLIPVDNVKWLWPKLSSSRQIKEVQNDGSNWMKSRIKVKFRGKPIHKSHQDPSESAATGLIFKDWKHLSISLLQLYNRRHTIFRG
jgi:hypothetical protein